MVGSENAVVVAVVAPCSPGDPPTLAAEAGQEGGVPWRDTPLSSSILSVMASVFTRSGISGVIIIVPRVMRPVLLSSILASAALYRAISVRIQVLPLAAIVVLVRCVWKGGGSGYMFSSHVGAPVAFRNRRIVCMSGQ